MSSYEETRVKLLETMNNSLDEGSPEYLNAMKSLVELNKAEAAQLHPETPECTGKKAWFERHSDALIRVGGTLATVVAVGFVESKFDVIFRSKASKYL